MRNFLFVAAIVLATPASAQKSDPSRSRAPKVDSPKPGSVPKKKGKRYMTLAAGSFDERVMKKRAT